MNKYTFTLWKVSKIEFEQDAIELIDRYEKVDIAMGLKQSLELINKDELVSYIVEVEY